MVQSIDRAMLIIDILNSDESKSNWQISELAEHKQPPLIKRRELTEIALTCNINDDKVLARASRTLHEFGSIVYFFILILLIFN